MRWSGQSHVRIEGHFQTHLFCPGDVKSLNMLVPVRVNGLTLPRTALGEEDSSLNVVGGDLGSSPQLR